MTKDFNWVTKDTRTFMSRGYLSPGVSVEERVKEIADHAEGLLGIEGFSDKFLNYMSKGYFSLSTPVWVNYGKSKGLPIACVTGNTLIYTRSNKGGILARDIQVGHEVLTHKGRYREVTAVIPTENKSGIYRLKVENREELFLTGNHAVLTDKGWVRTDELDDHLVAVNTLAEYPEIEYMLNILDYGYEGKDKCNSEVAVDKEVAWLLGAWYAQGESVKHYLLWNELVKNKFGTNEIEGTPVEKFFHSLNEEIPTWVLILPKEQINTFFDSFTYSGVSKDDTETLVDVQDEVLALQIYNLALKVGRGVYVDGSKIMVSSKSQSSVVTYNRIESLGRTDRVDTVYDFTVEEDHSFSAEGIVLHNCFSSYVNDSMDGIATTNAEVMMMSKYGGGTSSYWGDVRGRGEPISVGGNSEGSVNFMRLFDTSIDVSKQGDCYAEGTEVLTSQGFVDFSEVDKDIHQLAQVDENGVVSITHDYELIEKDYEGDIIKIRGRNDSILCLDVTPEHRMVVKKYTDSDGWSATTEIVLAKDLLQGYFKIPTSAVFPDTPDELDPLDRYFYTCLALKKGKNCLSVKNNKAWKLEEILMEAGVTYYMFRGKKKTRYYPTNSTTSTENYSFMMSTLSHKAISLIVEDILFWGFDKTTSYEDAKLVQTVFSLCGSRSSISVKEENGKLVYEVRRHSSSSVLVTDSLKVTKESYSGKVYCATVPTGRLVVRYKGTISVCGNSRRGSHAAYTDIDHPDILEFLEIRGDGTPIQNLFNGVCVKDSWMEDMIAGDKEKRKVWAKVLESRSKVGTPYIAFIDTINRETVDVYKDKELKILGSNLCVSPKTKILTGDGYQTISEIEGNNVSVWNGDEWSKVEVRKTGENQEMVRVTAVSGQVLDCTEYHKFYVQRDEVVEVRAKELQPGDVLIEFKLPFVSGTEEWDKVGVPLGNYTSSSKIKWIENYLDVYGVLEGDGVRVASKDLELLREVQLMLQTLGADSVISPFKTAHKIYISRNSLNYLVLLGLECDRLEWKYEIPEDTGCVLTIESVEYQGTSDTYCFTEPKKHLGVFNGFITGQCSEIALPVNNEESFVCCLSSINLLHIDEIEQTDAIETLIYFLDSVITEFVSKAKSLPYMEKAAKFAERHRALGLGTLGMHSYYQSKMIPFESKEAEAENIRIHKLIQERTYQASKELAEMFGEPEVLKGYGRRNTTTGAIAPTTSSAFILGQVSQSVEPYQSNYYVKDLAKIKTTIRNPYLVKLLEEKGKNTPETWDSILLNNGSVQHLEFLDEREKKVFKTFSEISQVDIIKQAADRQKYIDQSQSLNLMIHPKTSTKDLNALIIDAWVQGVKTLYYHKSINASQEFRRENILCSSCEG